MDKIKRGGATFEKRVSSLCMRRAIFFSIVFVFGCIPPPPNTESQPDLGQDLVVDENVPDEGSSVDLDDGHNAPDASGRGEDLGDGPPPGDPNPWPDGREPDLGSDASTQLDGSVEDANMDENGRPL